MHVISAAGAKSASFSYKRQNMKKQFKQADSQQAKYAVIVGQETLDKNEINVKELSTGEQKSLSIEEFLNSICG